MASIPEQRESLSNVMNADAVGIASILIPYYTVVRLLPEPAHPDEEETA
ncbi:MAG: hypothetical protein ACLQEQ_02060 [Nitrososphaerales archaeon]